MTFGCPSSQCEECHTVKEFLEIAFSYLELDPYRYIDKDEDLYRPSEVNILQGDASKAKKIIGWNYQISFKGLVEEMVENDLRRESRG